MILNFSLLYDGIKNATNAVIAIPRVYGIILSGRANVPTNENTIYNNKPNNEPESANDFDESANEINDFIVSI